MQNSIDRQKALLAIIGEQSVHSQGQLIKLLQQKGIVATQATLSRDLKALHIIKVPGEGYQLPQNRQAKPVATPPRGILSIEFSGTNAIIKTQVGFAPVVAAHIDKFPSRPVMGTLAGDDTVLVVLRQGFTPQECLSALEQAFPDLSSCLVH